MSDETDQPQDETDAAATAKEQTELSDPIGAAQPALTQGSMAPPPGLINHPQTPPGLLHDLNNPGDPRQQEPALVEARLRALWSQFTNFAVLTEPHQVPADLQDAVEMARIG